MYKKIRADYNQYGFWGFVKRVIKYFFRKIGVEYDSYYYMVNHIDRKELDKLIKKSTISSVKNLSYDDFRHGDEDVFTDKKMRIIKDRFSKDTFCSYGIINNERLIYSCWISLKEMELPQPLQHLLLDDEVLLLDDYCSPFARGRGIHTAMNAFRLCKIAEMGKSKAIVIILKENIPAYKSQLRVGFKTAFTYYIARLWGKTYSNYNKRLLRLRNE